MPPRALFLLFVGFAFPWCWRILRTVWSELSAAAAPPSQRSAAVTDDAWPFRDPESAPPRVRRRPAFRSASVRVEPHERWQGGFGRRSM